MLVYDNSPVDQAPALVCEVSFGLVQAAAEHLPHWVRLAIDEALPGALSQ